MTTLPFLRELLILSGVAVLAVLVLARLRLPTVTGLLLAGALVGPFGLHWVGDLHTIERLAEIGVVLLLFVIGTEFPLGRFARIGKLLVLGGSLQVGLTILMVVAVTHLAGESIARGVFLGFVFAQSSTSLVLRALSERREIDAPHGRFIMGVLVFQDLCVVPMLLLIPVLAGPWQMGVLSQTALALGKAVALVGVAMLAARWAIPKLFAWVDAVRSRELFLMTVLLVCLGTAWVTSWAGLSLALGAFLAGLVLAESDYAHRAMTQILPLRDMFASLFFMSLGMLFDFRMVAEEPGLVFLLVAGLVFGKGLLATVAALVMRFPVRVAWLAGVGLAQFGEFGFVICQTGVLLGLLTRAESHILLAAGILSMFITPLTMRWAPRFAATAALLEPLVHRLGMHSIRRRAQQKEPLTGHVVVAGFGIAGRTLIRALKDCGLPYVLLELNAETVRTARDAGEPAFYGDITSEETLHLAGLERAKALVLLISDPEATRNAVAAARQAAPKTPIWTRAHYLSERAVLKKLGATHVVVEESEAGVEMMSHVLGEIGVPPKDLTKRVYEARERMESEKG